MKKILVVSSYCFDTPFANGICSNSIAEILSKKGYEVYKVGILNNDENRYKLKPGEFAIDYRPTNEPEYKGIRRKIHNGINLLKQCFTSGQDVKKIDAYYSLVSKLEKTYDFDCIISFMFPPEAVTAVTKVKKQYTSLLHIIYELDSLTDGINHYSDHWYGKFICGAKIRWSNYQYRRADMICAMKCHESHIEKIYYKNYKDKFRILDLPLLKDRTYFNSKENDNIIRFLYTGEVSAEYRNPEKFLHLLEMTHNQRNWRIDFFCKGSGEKILKDYSIKDDRLSVHGYVQAKELDMWYSKADFLINIGNSVSKSLPSKLINYISYGKPIIHICTQQDDICVEYLSEYPLALVIRMDESDQDMVDRFSSFVESNIRKRIDFEQLQKTYSKNTAEYSADVIEYLFQNNDI